MPRTMLAARLGAHASRWARLRGLGPGRRAARTPRSRSRSGRTHAALAVLAPQGPDRAPARHARLGQRAAGRTGRSCAGPAPSGTRRGRSRAATRSTWNRHGSLTNTSRGGKGMWRKNAARKPGGERRAPSRPASGGSRAPRRSRPARPTRAIVSANRSLTVSYAAQYEGSKLASGTRSWNSGQTISFEKPE